MACRNAKEVVKCIYIKQETKKPDTNTNTKRPDANTEKRPDKNTIFLIQIQITSPGVASGHEKKVSVASEQEETCNQESRPSCYSDYLDDLLGRKNNRHRGIEIQIQIQI